MKHKARIIKHLKKLKKEGQTITDAFSVSQALKIPADEVEDIFEIIEEVTELE